MYKPSPRPLEAEEWSTHSKATNSNTNLNTQTDRQSGHKEDSTQETGKSKKSASERKAHAECWSRKEEENPFESQLEGQGVQRQRIREGQAWRKGKGEEMNSLGTAGQASH